MINFISTLYANGGGDGPEAPLDAMLSGIQETSWRANSVRYMFLITDMPSHGSRYHNFDRNSDQWFGGCPCGLDIEDIAP